jgi:MFS family permease
MVSSKEKENRRTINIFAGASFLQDLGSDMVFPIWPLFVTVFLKANLAVLGLIDGLGTAMVSLSQALSGYLSDRWHKRKPFIWSGYTMGGVARIGYAVSPTWGWLIPFKMVERTGKLRGAPRDAMVAECSTCDNRGANFGLLRTMDNLGAVCGVIATLLLFGILGYVNLFLVAAIPSFLAALVVLVFIKERKKKKAKECDPKAKPQKKVSFWDLSSNFKAFTVVGIFFALGNFSYSFLIIFASKTGMSAQQTVLMYLLFSVVATLLSFPFGKLADKIGRKIIVLVSFVSFALMSMVAMMVHDMTALGLLLLVFILYGVNLGALDPVQKAFVSELATPEFKASGLGIYQMAIGLVSLPASVLAGVLWDLYGSWAPFTFSALMTILACFALVFVHEKKSRD